VKRVIGIDPGTGVCGFGVVERTAAGLNYLAAGTIRTNRGHAMPRRLMTIHENLLRLIDEHAPDAMSLERSFVATNVQSAFRLGEGRAMAMLAAAERNLRLFEYAPAEVKLSVAGWGRAGKDQVKSMVRKSLGIDRVQLADDAADALALALCHLTRSRMAQAVDAVRRMPAVWRRVGSVAR